MKKLMFVAAAVACFGLNAEITSQNVVGYQTRDTEAGFSLSTPTFIPVGGGAYDLQNFKLGPDASGDETENIQIIDVEGQVTATYSWLNQNVSMPEGWYDSDWALVKGVTVKAGDGLLMYAANAGMDITTSGEVSGQDTVVTLPSGFYVVGNCSPVDLDLQKLTLPATAAGDETENIQIIDAEGQVTATYSWLNQNVSMPEGWYDSDWALVTGVTVKAGEALLMYTDAPTTLTIPSALK